MIFSGSVEQRSNVSGVRASNLLLQHLIINATWVYEDCLNLGSWGDWPLRKIQGLQRLKFPGSKVERAQTLSQGF